MGGCDQRSGVRLDGPGLRDQRAPLSPRRHCYYASPVLLAGALLTLLAGSRIMDLGADGLMYTTWGTFIAVLVTFLPEKIFGKHRIG